MHRILLASLLLFPTSALFAQGFDDCTGAESIFGTGNFFFHNASATTDGAPHPSCDPFNTDDGQIHEDVWFLWTVPADGDYRMQLFCSSLIATQRLALYAGATCPPGAPLGCAENICDQGTDFFYLVDALAGQQYLLRIGRVQTGVGAGSGTIQILPIEFPANDSCANPLPFTGVGSFPFNSTDATTDGLPDASCFSQGSDQIANDIWFAWTAPNDGDFVFQTCDSIDVQTKIAIYGDLSCPTGPPLDCNERAPSCNLIQNRRSRVFLTGAVGSQTYLLRIGTSINAATGEISEGGTGMLRVLEVTPPAPNDDCANAQDAISIGITFVFGFFATTDGPTEPGCGPLFNDLWYRWTVPMDGDYRVRLDTAFESRFAIYTGTACPTTGSAFACVNELVFVALDDLTAGDSFLFRAGAIAADDIGGNGAIFVDFIEPPPMNDDCEDATPITGTGTFPYDNSLAAGSNLPTGCPHGSFDADVFFAWTAPATGDYSFQVCGGNFGQLALYAGIDCPPAPALACADDCSFSAPLFVSPAQAGNVFLIQIGSFSVGPGELIIEASLGGTFCQSTANSTGLPARISASGSASVAANDLRLQAQTVPYTFGIFYYGQQENSEPFGNGTRCISGATFRLPLAVGQGGVIAHDIDNTNLPAGGVFAPGATWKFQAWFRDVSAGGAEFDLSNGFSLTMLP